MALKGTPPLPNINNSNWTLMYVLLGLIPVAFTTIAVYAVWRDTRTPPRDIEMAALPSQRALPWREAIAASERRGPRTGESSSRPENNRARKIITKPLPIVPVTPNIARPDGPLDMKEPEGRRGKNVSVKVDAAKATPIKQPRRKGVLGGMGRISEELEEVPF